MSIPHVSALEFARDLQMQGNKWAREIVEALEYHPDLQDEYNELCEELDYRAPAEMKGQFLKRVEQLRDRSDMLQDIEEALEEAGLLEVTHANGTKSKVDPDDAVKQLIERIQPVREYDL